MLGLNSNQLNVAKTTLKFLTIATASISLISLLQKLFNIGLIDIAATYIGYYRKIAYVIFGWPAEIFHFHMPKLLIDFWTLSFISAGAYVKTKDMEQARAFRRFNLQSPSIKLRAAVFLIFGFTGIGLAIPLSITSIYTFTEGDITRDALKNFAIILVVTVGFFVLNAFAPSA